MVLTCFHSHSRGYIPTPSSLTLVPILALHLPPALCLLHLPSPSPCCWLCSPICPKAGHSTLPFPIPLPRSELSICFPLALCIISQSLSSHPVTVHMCFYTFQPVTTDYFCFAATHSELLPHCNSVAQLWFLLTCLQIPPAGSCFPTQGLPWPLAAPVTSDPCFLCPFHTLLMPFASWLHWLPSILTLSHFPGVLRDSYPGIYSGSYMRKPSFLLITSDSSLHSSICLHFSWEKFPSST